MKWEGRRQSSNVERGRSSGGGGRGRGGIRLSGGALVLAAVVILAMGGNPLVLLGLVSPSQPAPRVPTEEATKREEFLSVVLADTEDVWSEIFRQYNARYNEPTLALYQDGVRTGCGVASSSVGPFYCPADERVYIDTSFYDELARKFEAPGDFAFAYVLAHEVGHHIQNELGTTAKLQKLRETLPEKEYNKYSVCLELQADYYAGVFAKYVEAKGYLEPGDLEEAMEAAAAVGDDRIQEKMTGTIRPDHFTHGSAKERAEWFRRGLKYGDLEHGDTFTERGYPLP